MKIALAIVVSNTVPIIMLLPAGGRGLPSAQERVPGEFQQKFHGETIASGKTSNAELISLFRKVNYDIGEFSAALAQEQYKMKQPATNAASLGGPSPIKLLDLPKKPNFQPRIHLPWKIGELPGTKRPAGRTSIRYQPPPVGIRLPAPQIEIGNLRNAFAPEFEPPRGREASSVMMTKRHIQFVRSHKLTDRHPSPQVHLVERRSSDTRRTVAPKSERDEGSDRYLRPDGAKRSEERNSTPLEAEERKLSSDSRHSSPSPSKRRPSHHAPSTGESTPSANSRVPRSKRRSSSVPSSGREKSPRVITQPDHFFESSGRSGAEHAVGMLVSGLGSGTMDGSSVGSFLPLEDVDVEDVGRCRSKAAVEQERTGGVRGGMRCRAESILNLLPEELILITCEFLDPRSQFELCVASNRVLPHVWGVVLVSFSRQLTELQSGCEAQGILTDIASQSQLAAQEEWWQMTQERKLMLEDLPRYRQDPVRFDLEIEELLDKESALLNRFQATVDVLAEVMSTWAKLCKHRDQAAKQCQQFHAAVGRVFAISS